MATIDKQVGASAGDAHEYDDGYGFSYTATFCRTQSSPGANVRRNSGFYWSGVDIPQGATIDVATMDVWVQTIDDPNLDIYGNDVDDANDFSTEADVTSRAKTSASASWSVNNIGQDAWKTTPSIVSPVQEIVNRPSWASGNAMCILFFGKNVVQSRILDVEPYDADPTHGAKLHIEYSVGAEPGYYQLQYTSEPPTPNAWNQLKREAGTGWKKLLYEGE